MNFNKCTNPECEAFGEPTPHGDYADPKPGPEDSWHPSDEIVEDLEDDDDDCDDVDSDDWEDEEDEEEEED